MKRYNKKNDERYIPREEQVRLRSKSKLSKYEQSRLDSYRRNSQDKFELEQSQRKAKAQIDYLIRQLTIHGSNGNGNYSYRELRNQLDEAHKTAWPNSFGMK